MKGNMKTEIIKYKFQVHGQNDYGAPVKTTVIASSESEALRIAGMKNGKARQIGSRVILRKAKNENDRIKL